NSSPFLPRLLDQLREPLEFVRRQIFRLEQGCDDALNGVAVERLEQRLRCATSHLLVRDRRLIDVSRAVALVPDMALLLENGEMRADRGIGRRIGDLLEDLRSGCPAELVERIHDLALAAAVAVSCGSLSRGIIGLASKHAKKLASAR